jgi:YfiH family protein
MLDIADLPQPNEAFSWVQAIPGPTLVCRPLAEHARHLFTTRHWLIGRDSHSWSDVAAALDLNPSRLVRVKQVHGAVAVVASATEPSPHQLVEADILVSGSGSTRGLAVQAADCVPLLIADRRTRAVAAAHAGWRGLAARVPSVVAAVMKAELGSRTSDLVAAIGPSIGACCYEVGGEVRLRFEEAGFDGRHLARWFRRDPAVGGRNPPMPGLPESRRAGHWFFDLWTSARDQLADAGVPIGQIHVAELCTASHPGSLCSYRRDGPPAGRLAGAIRPGP